jgi:hypothetical protein
MRLDPAPAPWLLTATGAQFDLLHADPASISVLDIAAALAKINRFNGHTSRPYSVAEHSLYVCQVMEREHGITNPTALMCGLMHDAHEAYTTDMPSPAKQAIDMLTGGGWRRFEAGVQAQVLLRFNLRDAMRVWQGLVHRADLVLLATERRDLLPPAGPAWEVLAGVPTSREIKLTHPAGNNGWQEWRDLFIERFGELHEAIAHETPGAHP